MRKTPGTMWPQKTLFYKGNTLSNWDCAQLARAKIQVMCFYKTELLPHGVCNLWFLAYAIVATLFLWNAYFL